MAKNPTIGEDRPYNLKSFHHPMVTVDMILFTIMNDELNVLLVKRSFEPYKDRWAIPGGFVKRNESLEDAARRELKEETNVGGVYLEQLYTFGEPKRDPRGRVITVAYFVLIPASQVGDVKAATDAKEAKWFAVKDLPKLAFDHDMILKYALQRLKWKMEYTNVVYALMEEEFTLSDLQKVYEIVFDREFDKRNFRKKIQALDLVKPTGKTVVRGVQRPAATYKFKKKDLFIVEIS